VARDIRKDDETGDGNDNGIEGRCGDNGASVDNGDGDGYQGEFPILDASGDNGDDGDDGDGDGSNGESTYDDDDDDDAAAAANKDGDGEGVLFFNEGNEVDRCSSLFHPCVLTTRTAMRCVYLSLSTH
jgi:hypothetical protein